MIRLAPKSPERGLAYDSFILDQVEKIISNRQSSVALICPSVENDLFHVITRLNWAYQAIEKELETR